MPTETGDEAPPRTGKAVVLGHIAREIVDRNGLSTSTTAVALTPPRKGWGTPEGWLDAVENALKKTKDGEGKADISRRIETVRSSKSKISWDAALNASTWDITHGRVEHEFEEHRPHMVTTQGQHRFAVLNAALHEQLGLSLSRGGDLGEEGVFHGEEDAARKEALEAKLKTAVRGCTVSFAIHPYMNHEEARKIAHDLRQAESRTTKESLLDVAKTMAPLIKQVYDPEQTICHDRAAETFGEAWKSNLTEPRYAEAGNRIKNTLKETVNAALDLIKISTRQQATSLFVFAYALCPKNETVQWLVNYLEQQETIKADANRGSSVPSPKQGKPEAVHPLKEFALQGFFSLTARTQTSPEVQSFIQNNGFCEEFRSKYAIQLATYEIIDAMVVSLLTRRHLPRREQSATKAHPAQDVQLLTNVMTDFVSEEETTYFGKCGEGTRDELRSAVKRLTPVLARFFGLPALDSNNNKINRTKLKKSVARRSKAFNDAFTSGQTPAEEINPSNTSMLVVNGFANKPFLSISGSEAIFSDETWNDWLEDFTPTPQTDGPQTAGDSSTADKEEGKGGPTKGKKGKGKKPPKAAATAAQQEAKAKDAKVNRRQRVVATFMACFIVDWFLEPICKTHKLASRADRFKSLVRAVHEGGDDTVPKLMRKALQDNPGKLQDGEFGFFNSERMKILTSTASTAGPKTKADGAAPRNDDDGGQGGSSRDDPPGGAPGRTGRRVQLSVGAGESKVQVPVSFTEEEMRRCGLMDEGGIVKKEPVICYFAKIDTEDKIRDEEKDTAKNKKKSGRTKRKRSTPTDTKWYATRVKNLSLSSSGAGDQGDTPAEQPTKKKKLSVRKAPDGTDSPGDEVFASDNHGRSGDILLENSSSTSDDDSDDSQHLSATMNYKKTAFTSDVGASPTSSSAAPYDANREGADGSAPGSGAENQVDSEVPESGPTAAPTDE
ncbi:unnamed protein product [Ectocarpus fasciculatus]